MRYGDLEAGCNRARSTAWFNTLINRGTWTVSPPDDSVLDELAHLLGTTRRRVAEMIAEEWYGVATAGLSARVRSLATRIDALDEKDVVLVEALIQRLQPSDS
jgi:hypothetical protein